ncbi:MAG: GNAT family N-acetyltransferase [Rickettsiaceae bacterium]
MIEYFFTSFPVFDLVDIVLREIREGDAQDYFNYMSREEMAQFLSDQTSPKTLDHAISEVRYWSSLFQLKRSFYWAIARKCDDKMIGTIGFNYISTPHAKANISYDLDYDFWGKGIMSRSMNAVLKFAELNLKLVRIDAHLITTNVRSINLLRRYGFMREGVMKKFEFIDGKYKDYYLYAKIY